MQSLEALKPCASKFTSPTIHVEQPITLAGKQLEQHKQHRLATAIAAKTKLLSNFIFFCAGNTTVESDDNCAFVVLEYIG